MYVFFENHRDEHGNVVATDIISSSYENNFRINWNTDKVQFEIMKKMYKAPPIGVRVYNDDTKIWSYLGQEGFFLLKTLEEAFRNLPQMRIEFRTIEGLEEAVRRGSITSSSKFDAKNFYYNRFAPTEELTPKTAAPLLAKLLGVSEDEINRRNYYRAVRLYHPDNQDTGDGKKMSEINMLWRIYNGPANVL